MKTLILPRLLTRNQIWIVTKGDTIYYTTIKIWEWSNKTIIDWMMNFLKSELLHRVTTKRLSRYHIFNSLLTLVLNSIIRGGEKGFLRHSHLSNSPSRHFSLQSLAIYKRWWSGSKWLVYILPFWFGSIFIDAKPCLGWVFLHLKFLFEISWFNFSLWFLVL